MWRSLKRNKDIRRRGGPRDEGGAVLLLVLLVLTLIGTLVLSWAQEWHTELRLSANYREAHQCRHLAEAGVYYALGKLLEAKQAETTMATADPRDLAAKFPDIWRFDPEPHLVELPGGRVEIRVEDEAGKINLNHANEMTLTNLFTVLGFPMEQVKIMVDSIQDWRSKDSQPRPYGAKSSYYQQLDPPYVARNGPFEVVEELAWVRGFEASPIIPRLGSYLTAQGAGQGLNINTAPLEVLLAAGLPPDQAQAIILNRQQQPFRNFQDMGQIALSPIQGQFQQLGFQSSPFFTIKSKGMVNKQGGRQTIKVMARLDLSLPNSWEILSWVDDFPG